MNRWQFLFASTFWVFHGCGATDGSTSPAPDASGLCSREAAAGDGLACSPRLPDCWTPTWRPPRAPARACTESQIVDEVTKCFSGTFDPDCDVFERDPANAACLGCIFSTYDEPSYGAVIFLSNGSWESNVPGCLALLDGDTSAAGCGAKAAAYEECNDGACATCSTYETYANCWSQAALTVCTPLREGAVCRRKPSYDICTSYRAPTEYFVAMAKIFCESGLDGGTTIDAGSSDDGRD